MELNQTAPLARSLDEAARLLGVSRRHLERLIGDGRLRSVRLGRRRVIPHDALEDLLADRHPQPEESQGEA
jgi:excisionase family DNA binding protein